MKVGYFDGRLAIERGGKYVELEELIDWRCSCDACDRMIEAIKRWPEVCGAAENAQSSQFRDVAPEPGPIVAPLRSPNKIIGAPANYLEHIKEMGAVKTVADLGVFLKAPTAIVGPGACVELPYSDRRTDHEGELAVVIGRQGRHIDRSVALDYVFGYTCLLDITVRGSEERSTRKSFDTFCPIGPWIVTADEVGDPGALGIRTWVNDELRQDGNTADLIFGVPELIAFASEIMTLSPGDVIATGTPSGVGPLVHGDSVAVEIERIGRLEVSVSAARAVEFEKAVATRSRTA